jgi:C4-dicarboxylate-binding protein DctP
MKKQIIPTILSASLILSALGGCSSSTGSASTQTAPSSQQPESSASQPVESNEPEAVQEPVNEAVLKVNTGAVAGEDLYEMFVTFGEKLEEVSGGAMTIDLYSSSDYRDSVALDDVLNDNADIVYLSSASASSTVSEIAYMGLYGCYNYINGYDDTESFLSFFDATKDAVNDIYSDYNCHLLSYRVPGYLVIASSDTDVQTPSDLSGKIMRTSGTWTGQLAAAMGISTATVKITEIATALQRGTVDAALSGDAQCRDLMFYEVSNNISIFPEADQVGCVVCCQSTWDQLDERQQECVEEAAYYAMVEMLEGRGAEYQEMLELFQANSDVRIITEEECAQWTSYVPAIYEQIDASVGEKGPVLKEAILSWRAANGLT